MINKIINSTPNGIFNNIFLAWFGGNVGASTSDVSPDALERFDWWGNVLLFPNDPKRQYNSRLENLLNTVELNSAGLSVIQTIAKSDLDFMSEIADITVTASIVRVDTLRLSVLAVEKTTGVSSQFSFIWDDLRVQVLDSDDEPVIFINDTPAAFDIIQNDFVDMGVPFKQGEGRVRVFADDTYSVNARGELIVDGLNAHRYSLNANGEVIFN